MHWTIELHLHYQKVICLKWMMCLFLGFAVKDKRTITLMDLVQGIII